jgi:prepilin-type N-terminal cleavage/methylation domain-containing protein
MSGASEKIYKHMMHDSGFKSDNRDFKSSFHSKGFSLIELLISVTIVAILAGLSARYYGRAYREAILRTNAEQIQSVLRLARQRTVSQQEGVEWGVHFENLAGGADFYEIYKTATYSSANVTEKYFLDSILDFTSPPAGTSTNVLFSRRTGETGTTTDITLFLSVPNATRTIRIYPSGVVEML